MGKFYVESMQTKDQTMILAVVLIFGVFLAVMNILVDIVYGVDRPPDSLLDRADTRPWQIS